MSLRPRDFVVLDLITFFKTHCANASMITGEASEIKYLCGYINDPSGWCLLAPLLSELPHIHSYGFCLGLTQMDTLATIGQIADAVVASEEPKSALVGAGHAKFVAPTGARSPTD